MIVKYDCNVYGDNQAIIGNTTLGYRNPFRYKGYYYDSETDWFYCQSRYYVPEWCRWLTPDSVYYLNPFSINGMNLYSYCFNDSINYVDHIGMYPVKIQVGKLTIYFHTPHGNVPNAQHHVHIMKGNVRVASRNYDGSIHDKKYGKNYVPSDDVYNALLEHGWDWYGNKFSLFDFSDFYKEDFPLQPSGYSLEQFPFENIDSTIEVFPNINNDFTFETFPNDSSNVPNYNPIPLTNNDTQVLVIACAIIVVAAIALIPYTGGSSAALLFV